MASDTQLPTGVQTPSNAPEFSVSELAGAVKRAIEGEFGYVRVRGELGRVTIARSGHMYADLKDERAVISGVAWKGVVSQFPFRPEEGLEVVATGKMSTFAGQSKYQLIIDRMEPAGAGALMALLEERKKKLAAEGLFAAERKRALPRMPKVIGVVTSPTGAVIRDILHRLADRFPVHVVVWPVLVQGDAAAGQIAAAVQGFNALKPGGGVPRPDVLIVARGGGSVEDLWAFNEEVVVRAAAGSDIPLISAVGHETDTTLIDYAADRRAPTPTGAAEMAVPVRSELLTHLMTLSSRKANALRGRVERAEAALRAAARGLPRPTDMLAQATQRLDYAAQGLRGGLSANTDRHGMHFHRVSGRMRASLLSKDVEARAARVTTVSRQLGDALTRQLERRRDRLEGRGERLATRAPLRQLERSEADFRRTLVRFGVAARQALDRREQALAAQGKLLETLSHKSVLARGFALVTGEAGRLVRSAVEVPASGPVTLTFADGAAIVYADGSNGRQPNPQLQPSKVQRPKPSQPKSGGGQGSLF